MPSNVVKKGYSTSATHQCRKAVCNMSTKTAVITVDGIEKTCSTTGQILDYAGQKFNGKVTCPKIEEFCIDYGLDCDN